jgi:proline-specific peptidase
LFKSRAAFRNGRAAFGLIRYKVEDNMTEGTIPFKGYKTWFRRVGEAGAGKIPLLVLHGGPGAAHSYMLTLDGLAKNGREVIYYDQVGCGNSPGPSDADFYSVELFKEELATVIDALGLKEVHILGQSWGGMLLMDYMISKKPRGVKSIVLSSSPASVPLFETEIKRLVSWLPPDVIAALEKGMKDKKYDSPDFLAASDVYYARHVVNLDPMPDFVTRSLANMGEVYIIMQGHTEFMFTGKLKTWDVSSRLHEITVPALLVSGVSDEVSPLLIKQEYDRIPNAEWHLLPGTHLIHVERRDEYNRLVDAFLAKQDAA